MWTKIFIMIIFGIYCDDEVAIKKKSTLSLHLVSLLTEGNFFWWYNAQENTSPIPNAWVFIFINSLFTFYCVFGEAGCPPPQPFSPNLTFPVTSKSQSKKVMMDWSRWKVRLEGLYIDVVTITVKVTHSTTAGLYFHLRIVLEVERSSLWPEYK